MLSTARADSTVWIMCAEEGGKWWRKYRRMQHVRVNKLRRIRPSKWPKGFEKKREKDFRALIESFREKGYDMSVKGIRLDKDMELCNGSHRLACCILYGIEEIPVQFPMDSTKVRRHYATKWFRRAGFGEGTLRDLEARRKKLIEDLGLKDRTTNEYFSKAS